MCIIIYKPVFIFWDGGKWRVQTVGVIGHVTFITQQLLFRILLDATDVAVTPLAVFVGIIFTAFALRSI